MEIRESDTSLDEPTRQRITELVSANEVVLFMKGDRQAPQCGFSATVVQILDAYLPDYETLDVLSNPDIRDGIKTFSSWPTIPQLYVKGEFVGGCDIIQELAGSGELFETLGVEPPPEVIPTIHITDAARVALAEAATKHGSPGKHLHLVVDPSYQNSLQMAVQSPLDVEIESNGTKLMLDRMSAARAEGITIDVAETPGGQAFRLDNPNAPQIKNISVHDLKRALDAGEPFELLDVRPPEENAIASIPGAILVNQEEAHRVEGLSKETRLVFHCHHGSRSQQAAEHFLSLGFRNVENVEGGIEAWSTEIDPSVPRY